MSSPDDAVLARAAAAGDRAALAAIYDRYANRLHDFCIGMLRDREAAADCVQDVFVTAATKLGQLRDAERLRPWLYAIARSECLARIRERKREQPTEDIPDMPSHDDGPDTMVARADLAELVRAASAGLSDRDRVVLELSYRQGLAGPELADALGVTPRNANTLVERLRDTFARSLGALLLSRRVSADPAACPELAALLADWDGVYTVLMRKRIARHVDDCAVCDEARSRMVSPAALLAAAPVLVPAPVWLRQRTVDRAGAALPSTGTTGESWWPEADFDDVPVRSGVSRRVVLGAAIALIAIGGAVVLATQSARVVPTNSPSAVTSVATSTSVTRSTTPPPPPLPVTAESIPTTTTTATTPPSAIPRTQEPAPPPTTTPPPFTRNEIPTSEPPTTTRRTTPKPEPEQEPDEPSQPPPSTPKKNPVPPIEQAPPVDKSPDQQCTPANPCPSGPPVFS